ncbi:MAG: single-stranded DNA-binding protein [Nitrospirota bacterium]
MAMSLNKVQLIGNLTRDPELKQIPGGQVVASFGLATNFTWKDQSGEKQSKAEFHNIVAWRKLAEICGQYLKKGSKIYIEGRIQTRDWEGEDGTKRYRTEITADNMIMLDSRGGGAPMEREAAGIPTETAYASETGDLPDVEPAAAAPVAAGNEEKKEEDVSIDDLPF